MADPEPTQPVPFPIRIIKDDPPPRSNDTPPNRAELPTSKRSDYFYKAWDKFLAIEPRRARSISTTAKKVEEERKEVKNSPGDGLQVEENAFTSWEHAAAECKAKVAAIVEECHRLNQKYRDQIFNLETNHHCLQNLEDRCPRAVDRLDSPPWIKRVEDIFDDPQFFIDGATATDVHQGNSGDCWFLAALMAVSARKELIDRLCVARDEKVGVYGFVFYRDGEWIYEVIDDKLYLRVGDDDDVKVVRDWDRELKGGMALKHDAEKLRAQMQRGGEALYFSHCKSSETWLPLIEKAYAKAHGDYFAIEGGSASEGIEDLTGGVGVVINPEDIMDKDRFWREQLSQVNEKYLFGGGSKPQASKGFVGGHAYAVLKAWEDDHLKLLKIRNPWGRVEWEGDWSDGSKLWTPDMMKKLDHTFGDDGVFWIGYKDFLQHFPSINRVRLFSKDWQVAQQWTSVNVPWTVEYLDTKFQFSITEKCSVVLVLSQPDERYFQGLQGRYWFSLHFRVYKEGDDKKYIVRSMHNSGTDDMVTRSVSAEIEDLEPGTYDVVFKVTAIRAPLPNTAEEAIFKCAVDRKEKLLHVGRRFDYAHTKGNRRALEESNSRLKRLDEKFKDRESMKRERMLTKKDKERERKRKKRAADAMREKRRAVEMLRREKAKNRRQRRRERRQRKSTEAQAAGGCEENSDSKDGVTPQTEGPSPDVDAETNASEAKSDTKGGVGEEAQLLEGREGDEGDGDEGDWVDEDAEDGEEGGAEPNDEEMLSKGLSRPELDEAPASERGRYSSSEESEYESSVEAPEELTDEDFDWDSEIDGPYDSDEEGEPSPPADNENGIFADDPWNAMCVLSLRVYSLNADAKVRVVKGENSS